MHAIAAGGGRTRGVWAGAATALLLCAACTGATPYQPESGEGGYADFQLADDLFDVAFRGNKFTPEEMVRMALLYRSAEVTRQHGFQYFIVLEEGYRASTSLSHTPGSFSGTSRQAPGGQTYTTGTMTPGATLSVAKYRGLMRIKTFREGQQPAGGLSAREQVYHAEKTMLLIAPQIGIAPPERPK